MPLPAFPFTGVCRFMEYTGEIYSLSSQFYIDYPHNQFPEILTKPNRPYSCLLVEYFDDLFICVPYRTQIHHPYAYHFKTSARSKHNSSGLDYTKSVLIKNDQYLDTTALVDQDEYRETIVNLSRIAQEVVSYVSDYKDDLNHIKRLHPREWQRRYGKSTLPYFDTFLTEHPNEIL